MRKNIFQFAVEELETGSAVVWATIFRRFGSAPRGAGARMVVAADGRFQGTIGGGRLEATIQKDLPVYLQERNPRILDFKLSEEDAADLDMICGGNVSVLVEPVFADQHDLVEAYRRVSEIIREQKSGWLLSPLPLESAQKGEVRQSLVDREGNISGNWLQAAEVQDQNLVRIRTGEKDFSFSQSQPVRAPQVIQFGEVPVFIDPVGEFSSVYLIGAGHIAQKLAPLTRLTGFRTVVADDRADLLDKDHFPQADQFIALDNFQAVFRDIPVDASSFLVIVTRGHSSDKDVLGQALQTDAGYIGMIGSKRKIQATFDALRKEGLSEDAFARVHTPIGLDIGAETPEEIAVSITAELIRHRARHLKNR